MPEKTLPMELLCEIICCYMRSLPPKYERNAFNVASKPEWMFVEPLSLASWTIRTLVMKAWFETYIADSPSDLLDIEIFPRVSIWTRKVHCNEPRRNLHLYDTPLTWNLRKFWRVSQVRLDSNPIHVLPFSFHGNVASLREFEVVEHSWPSVMHMRKIAEILPQLRILRLSQSTTWCSACNTCETPSFSEAPPSPIVYNDAIGLPVLYRQIWASLRHLHTVVLTVGYHKGGKTRLEAKNEILWNGECDSCLCLLYADSEYFAQTVAKKKHAARPPSLRRVEWRFVEVDIPSRIEWPVGEADPPD